MSTTKEEAITNLEKLVALFYTESEQSKMVDYSKIIEALEFAAAALRPVSREQVEQVEKVWPGCDICRGDKKIKSDNFCGAATMQIVGDSIDLRGDKKKIKFFGHIYAPSFSVRFCPFCGKPLTDEAVDIVMERLEALRDE